MKRLIVALLFTAAAGSVLEAQTVYMKAAIPFEFHAGKNVLPAGEYSIQGTGPALVLRHQGGGKGSCILLSIAVVGDRSPDARLTFRRYGDTYFLRTVCGGSAAGSGRELPESRIEKELAKNRVDSPDRTAILAQVK